LMVTLPEKEEGCPGQQKNDKDKQEILFVEKGAVHNGLSVSKSYIP
jgi:hypothetical protein